MAETKVILSTTILLGTGNWKMEEITLAEARAFATEAENFCGHPTVKLLGIMPTTDRKECLGYEEAVVIKPSGRLEFGRDYSVEEIEKIGYTIFKISRQEKSFCP